MINLLKNLEKFITMKNYIKNKYLLKIYIKLKNMLYFNFLK